jgi:multiple sugar transport system permease protein
MLKKRDKSVLLELLFIIPAVLVFILLLLYPVLSSIFYSFTNKHLIKSSFKFVMFDNYIDILTDPEYWSSLLTGVKWTVLSLLGQFLIGFTAALALNRINKGRTLLRTLIIIPWAFPTIVIALAWKWILNGVSGFVPNLLFQLGITDSIPGFLSSKELVFLTMLFINVWFGSPLIAVNILSALQTVPAELSEAAKIDGANSFQRLVKITIPQIIPVLLLLLVLRTIWIFNAFDIIYLITGGGPAGITQTVPIYAYKIGWGLKWLGKSSAVSVLSLIFLIIISSFLFALMRKVSTNENEK